jgi:uncharacterized phosphosugar-binding protein/N-acetylglucosamine kinase-like BadF-type ATPase
MTEKVAPAVFVGVDGGQSQLRLRIAGDDEIHVVPGVGHGDDVSRRLCDAIRQAANAANLTSCTRLVAGLTALPSDPAGVAALSGDLARMFDADEVLIFDDTVTAHSAAFAGGSGIALVVGTGVACLATDSVRGLIHRTSGSGFLIGDEGGAYWIGRHGVAAAIKAYDGRGAATLLLDAAVIHFGCEPSMLADHIHNSPRAVSSIAEFAVAVVSAADAGDESAEQVLRQATAELAMCVQSCVSVLAESKVGGVALMGRLLTESASFAALVSARIAELEPDLSVRIESRTPLDGALALAGSADIGIYRQALMSSSSGGVVNRIPGAAATAYLGAAKATLGEAAASEVTTIADVAEQIATRLIDGGMIHTFGSGHSHMLAEELFYRAGGLARVDPILVDELMLHVSASESTHIERQPGLASELLRAHPMKSQDVLIVASNSGGNSVSIELAQRAHDHGVLVVALTSLTHARSAQARSNAGPRLHEIADVVLDNHGVVGDAALPITGIDCRVGATSTVVGAALLQALAAEIVACMIDKGVEPEVFASSNTAGGDDINRVLLDRYRNQVKSL